MNSKNPFHLFLKTAFAEKKAQNIWRKCSKCAKLSLPPVRGLVGVPDAPHAILDSSISSVVFLPISGNKIPYLQKRLTPMLPEF